MLVELTPSAVTVPSNVTPATCATTAAAPSAPAAGMTHYDPQDRFGRGDEGLAPKKTTKKRKDDSDSTFDPHNAK